MRAERDEQRDAGEGDHLPQQIDDCEAAGAQLDHQGQQAHVRRRDDEVAGPAERRARDHPRGVARDQCKSDEERECDRCEGEPQPEEVGDQHAALTGIAQREVAATREVQPGVRDRAGNRDQ